jgi:F-type H+-transporting ATPase subunit a
VIFLAEAAPGTHPTVEVCKGSIPLPLGFAYNYCAFNYDSLVSTGLAILVTLAVGFAVAYRLRHGVPGKLQMVFELMFGYVRGMVSETVADDAAFVVPLAITIGFYILVANWLDFFPLPKPLLHPANSDWNQTLAMALVVIIVVQWYSLRVLGLRGYLRRFTKPFELPLVGRILFIPLNIIEEVVKPVTLSLRLFGNIFAGLLMAYLLTLLPIWAAAPGLVLWKAFDVFFVGTIQAFIFMLLTIIYFGMAREGLEEEGHGPASGAAMAGHAREATTPAVPH